MTDTSPGIRIHIQGEFGIFTAAALRQQLLDALESQSVVEVDLSSVSEMDSAGIQLMIAAKKEAAQRNKQLHFIAHSAVVTELLSFCNLSYQLSDLPHTQD